MIIIAHDFETTGLDPDTCGVVQFAVGVIEIADSDPSDISLLENHVELVHPGTAITEETTKIHGITDTDVAGLPNWKESLRKVYAGIMERYPNIQVVMGYNNRNYDDPIAYRAGMPRLLSFDLFDYGREMKRTKQVDKARLVDVYKKLTGKELSGAHDAWIDIAGCIEIIPHLSHEFSHSTLPEMIDFATPNINPDALVGFGKHAERRICELPNQYINWLLTKSYVMPRDLIATVKHLRGL